MTGLGIVIIGAAEAGVRGAIELRTNGWNGPMTLLDEKLSHNNIRFMNDRTTVEIERGTRTIILDDG
jgi:hypothetical protein